MNTDLPTDGVVENNDTNKQDPERELPTEAEFMAQFEREAADRWKKLARAKKIKRITSLALAVGFVGGAYGWYASSPDNQTKAKELWAGAVEVKESFANGGSVTDIVDSYDEALGEIDAHGDVVANATAALNGEAELELPDAPPKPRGGAASKEK